MNWQYDKPKTYQGCSHKLDAPQSTQTKYPVLGLGHAGVRVLRVRLGARVESEKTESDRRLGPSSAEVDKCVSEYVRQPGCGETVMMRES